MKQPNRPALEDMRLSELQAFAAALGSRLVLTLKKERKAKPGPKPGFRRRRLAKLAALPPPVKRRRRGLGDIPPPPPPLGRGKKKR